MRRTTSGTLLEEARLLTHLLKHAPDKAIVHHSEDIRSFLQFLHERAEITHSVSDLLPKRSFPHPDALIAGSSGQAWESRLVGSRTFLFRILGELAARKVKIGLRSE